MFYLVAFLRSALPDSGDPTQSLEYLSRQNKKILDFCDDAGIEIKQYLPVHRSRAEWARHFGPKWACDGDSDPFGRDCSTKARASAANAELTSTNKRTNAAALAIFTPRDPISREATWLTATEAAYK
ncbi:hypothetical protein GW17_00014085 [Ensete ventricosum]|nr:hypothetical protein GW17_00014085 [Ensete ventricosum]